MAKKSKIVEMIENSGRNILKYTNRQKKMKRGDNSEERKIMHEFHSSFKTDLKGLIKLHITHTEKAQNM